MARVIGTNPAGETLDMADGVTNSADLIVGLGGPDTIYGFGGDDVIKGGGGADRIFGGTGWDAVSYDDSSVGVYVNLHDGTGHYGTAEDDTYSSIENVYGSAHDDTIIGTAGWNDFRGGDGNDTLKGGGGSDRLNGGAGNDMLNADGIGDTFDGGSDVDTVSLAGATAGRYINLDSGVIFALAGAAGMGTVANVENVTGSEHDDIIFGDANDNVLKGGTGDDEITGGGGADRMYGNTGADTFRFTAISDSAVIGGSIQDYILEFKSGRDKIDLSELDYARADLLMINQVLPAGNFTHVGIDTNHNGGFDASEFAVSVQLTSGFLVDGDIIH